MQFTKNLQRFRLITFDITDTLLKFKEEPVKVYAQNALNFGFKDIEETRLRDCFRQQFKIMAKKYPNFGCKTQNMTWKAWWLTLVTNTFNCFNQNYDQKLLQQLAEHLFKIFRTKECWILVDSGECLIKNIRENGKCKIGVISNSEPSLRDVLKDMNILQNFDFVLTSYEAGVEKPEKEIFNLALQQGNVKPNECLHIGNSFELDFLGATNAGWSSLLVTAQIIPESALIKKDLIYESMSDMLKALETKNIVW